MRITTSVRKCLGRGQPSGLMIIFVTSILREKGLLGHLQGLGREERRGEARRGEERRGKARKVEKRKGRKVELGQHFQDQRCEFKCLPLDRY